MAATTDTRVPGPGDDRDPFVHVAGARHLAEAELLQDVLRQAGIPSLIRRNAAFDVPELLVAGRRDVLVRASDIEAAYDLLMGFDVVEPPPSRDDAPGIRPLFRVLLVAVVLVTVVAWLSVLQGAR